MKFTKTHEWIEVKEGIGTVGITKHAQQELGDIVYAELPQVGKEVKASQEVAVLESTKAAADIYSPVSGTILEVNQSLRDQPELINQDAEAAGWLYKIRVKDEKEVDVLLDRAAYHHQSG